LLKYIITATGIGVGIFAALIILFPSPVSEPLTFSETPQGINSNRIMVTDGLKHIVPLDKIKGGGPPKDGIPSIDDPQFAALSGSSFMTHSDIVIGLEINGEGNRIISAANIPTPIPVAVIMYFSKSI